MIYIYGEAHFQKASLDYIADEIRRIKPKIIMHELVDSSILNPTQVRQHLKNAGKPGSACDPELNIDIFELAAEVGAHLTSFDLPMAEKEELKERSLADQFAIREAHMVGRLAAIPKSWSSQENIVAVVGDAHLRTKHTKKLGSVSPLQIVARQAGSRWTIIRTQKEFQEVE